MSDFETVLERLLLDPAFKAALSADPQRALAGYILDDDERELLLAQVSADAGQSMRMEDRTSKAALFGLIGAAAEFLAPPAGLSHLDAGVPPPTTKDESWLLHQRRTDGFVEVGDYDNTPPSSDFFHGLVSETGIPESDGASKDPAYLTVKWADTPRAGGAFADPTAGDGPQPPPDPDQFKVAPDEFKVDPTEIKMAPTDIKMAPEVFKVGPDVFKGPGELKAEPTGIKMEDVKIIPEDVKIVPGDDAQFDPPAPIRAPLPDKPDLPPPPTR